MNTVCSRGFHKDADVVRRGFVPFLAALFSMNILILIILRILTSQVFSKFILPHPAAECPETHSAISAEMALISKKTASRVPGSRFCQLIFFLVEFTK